MTDSLDDWSTGRKTSFTRYFFIAVVLFASIAIGLPFCHSTQVMHPLRMAMVGYIFSLVSELPVLLICLSDSHKMKERVIAGLWLTACTYPFVSWVFPNFIHDTMLLTIVRETFAALGEALLFWLAFVKLANRTILPKRDLLVVVIANVMSFLFGEILKTTGAIWTILEWFQL